MIHNQQEAGDDPASLSSPSDAQALDALPRHITQVNIASLVLLNSKLANDDLRFELQQNVRDVAILAARAERIAEGFTRAAERRLVPATPMQLAKDRLAEILKLKGRS